MIISLASPCVATSLEDGLERVKRLQAEAAAQEAQIICFPEAYLPGLHGVGIDVLLLCHAHCICQHFLLQ